MTPVGSASAMARLYSHGTLMFNDHEPKIDQQERVLGLGPALILTGVSASRNQPKWKYHKLRASTHWFQAGVEITATRA